MIFQAMTEEIWRFHAVPFSVLNRSYSKEKTEVAK